jgi:hypothetical protein
MEYNWTESNRDTSSLFSDMLGSPSLWALIGWDSLRLVYPLALHTIEEFPPWEHYGYRVS